MPVVSGWVGGWVGEEEKEEKEEEEEEEEEGLPGFFLLPDVVHEEPLAFESPVCMGKEGGLGGWMNDKVGGWVGG